MGVVARIGLLLLAVTGVQVVDLPCVPEPVFPDDCVQRLGTIGGPVLDRAAFRNVVSPVVDPLLLLRSASGLDGRLYALNPSADSVRVFDTGQRSAGLVVLRDIPVCRRPSALAQSHSGAEVFVACHGSAAVAVIDTARDRVVAVIQDRDDQGRPRLSEPMGMVATGGTLYVASSGNERIAVVDTRSRSVTRYIDIPGRDPRSLALAGGGRYLVVANFLAGNRSEPRVEDHPAVRDPETAIGAVCAPLLEDAGTAPLADESSPRFMDTSHASYAEVAECYLFAKTFGSSSMIVRQPRRADHDLVVVDLSSGQVVFTSDALDRDVGALNYGMTVDDTGLRLYVVATQARNDLGHAFGLRPVVNQLAILDLDPATGALSVAGVIDLDSAALGADGPGRAVAPIPSAVAISGDGLLITSAAADTLVTANKDGLPRASIPVGFGPRGIVASGDVAFVYNATGLSVSRVDLRSGRQVDTALVGPSPLSAEERIGARLFNSARFSPNGSFACASCHPDGHQDGLVWEMNDRDGLRATLPVAGVAESAPYHWDGSKCNLHDIVQDSVADLFRNPKTPDACEIRTMIDYMRGLAQPGSPFRALDDSLSHEALLGSAIVHRGRFKDAQDTPRTCSGRFEDPAAETLYLQALDDPFGATFRFNGGGSPVPATRSSESCSLANCHVAPFDGSDGFRNGDPRAGLIDGYQAVSTVGVWNRASTQHDGRTMREGFVKALQINRAYHGAETVAEGGNVSGMARLAAQAFNDANFRHAEYNFDDRPETHGFRLTDAITRYMMEEQAPESAAVGLTLVVDRREGGAEQKRLLSTLLDAARQRKLRVLGVGTLGGEPTTLEYAPEDDRFVADDGKSYSLVELRQAMTPGDLQVLRGAPLPAPAGARRPKLRSVLRDTSPILCSEDHARYLATLETGENDVTLIVRGTDIAPGSRVLIDGRLRGAPLSGAGPEFTWTLPQAPLAPSIVSLQLLSPDGLLSNSLPLPVVNPVVAAFEPADVVADVTGDAGDLVEFAWLDQLGLTGPGTRFDVFRGNLAALRSGNASSGECITPAGWARPKITDGAAPDSGTGLFYLVRAQNQLGVTSWGSPRRDAALQAADTACTTLFPLPSFATASEGGPFLVKQ